MSKEDFINKTKEELIEIIFQQSERILKLEEKIQSIEDSHKNKSQPSFTKTNVRKYHHRPGQKQGHVGISRFS